MQKVLTIQEAAERLRCTERHVRRMCLAGKLPGAVRDGDSWQIPQAAHVRLMDEARPDKEFDLALLPRHKQETALWRLGIVQEAETFAAIEVRQGRDRLKALQAFADQARVGLRSLQRWISDWRKRGVEGLVDTRGLAAGGGCEISGEAWDEFKSLYLVQRQPSVKQCRDMVIFKSDRDGLGWRVPSLRRMQQIAIEDIPEPVRILHREGKAAYDAKCAPYIQTDMESIEPGAVWIGDHHQCDCWVRYRGNWIRPWVTAWEDMRSRAIVGYVVTDSPNSTTILQAFRRGCEAYGPPAGVKIDNGKDYDSELFTGTTKQRRRLNVAVDEQNIAGLYAMMNISVSFAIPYHPQSKAIERWFDTFEGQFVRMLPTYCGKDTQRRPEDLPEYLKSQKAIDEALSLDEFAQMAGEYIDIYNHTSHTGRGMDGRTPIQVMQTRPARRMVDEQTLRLLCQVWTGELKVGKNGVQIRGLWYGQADATLMMHFGRPVRCAYDPDDMTDVKVYDANTYQYIATVESASTIGYGTALAESDLRDAMAAKQRAKKIVKQFKPAARTAATDLPHLALAAAKSRTQTTAAEENKPIRPVRTPLDGQAAAVRRTERVRAIKKAAGAEGMRSVIDLHLDYEEPHQAFELPNLGLDIESDEGCENRTINLRLYDE